MSRIYESAEYYQKVKETGNALEREYLEEERWRRRDPFDDEFFNRGSSTHSNRSGSRFSQPSSHRNLERSFVDERDIEQTSSRMRSYRNEIRVDDCAPRQRSTPAAYMDEPPVYSIINSRPSDYSSRTDFHEERSQQQELTRSRPGSPQVVAGPGEIINTEHGFTIELDVKHFRPHDIKVTLTGNTLSVVGDRLEDDNTSSQTLRRSFTRKYSIPNDVRMSSISSYMTDSGLLIIRGSRKGWKETEISVHVAPPERHVTSSVISIV
uniref:SHSP domain-containing protein n=2 Tax=Parascaris univalens TaxID=6257 RepID=A0A915B326_PARUN